MTQPSLHNDSQHFYREQSAVIIVGNGQNIQATAVTDIDIDDKITLRNVFLVPNVSANLISVAQSLENGIDEISFTRHAARIIKNGVVVATGSRTGNLFKLNLNFDNQHTNHYSLTATTPSADLMTWHRRLGHISFRSIRHLNNHGLIKVNNAEASGTCHACAIGKMTRQSFSSSRPHIRSSSFGEIIHSDVCGPFSTQGVRGERYYVPFFDNFHDIFLFSPS